MSSYTGYFYAFSAAVIWGIVYTINQRVLRDASPFALLFIDALITALILLPAVLIEKDSLSSLTNTPVKVWLLIIAGTMFTALANYFIFSSIKLIDADHASIIEIMYPFFIVIFSYFAFNETPNLYFLLGSVLIFSGSAVIILFK